MSPQALPAHSAHHFLTSHPCHVSADANITKVVVTEPQNLASSAHNKDTVAVFSKEN